MSTLRVNKLTKQYKADSFFSLHIDELTVEHGELFVLLGPSGCGKSTLLKTIAGLVDPDKGDVMVDTKRMNSLSPEERGFGMVFQQPLLFPHMTVGENVAFGLKMRKVPKPKRRQKVREFLERLGLKNFESRYPRELSGGQQQRVSLARSLIIEPPLLLMDEPFSALDPDLREDMRTWLKDIHRQTNATILLVTHDLEEAFSLADRIGVMDQGRLLQVDTPEKLYRYPSNPIVARFVGIKNLLSGEVEDGWFQSKGQRIPIKQTGCSGNGVLAIPSHAIIVKEDVEGLSEKGIKGMVQEIRFQQGQYRMTIDIGGIVLETVQSSERCKNFTLGSPVELEINHDDLHFMKASQMERRDQHA